MAELAQHALMEPPMSTSREPSRPEPLLLGGPTDPPNYLVIKFDPSNLPAGAVDIQDVAQFTQGLQELIDGMLLSDVPEERAKDLAARFRIVALAPTQGSYELTITLAPILESVLRTIDTGSAANLDPKALLELFVAVTATSAGGVVGAKAGNDLYNVARNRLGLVLALLHATGQSDWQFVGSYLTPTTLTGLKRIWRVIKRPANLTRPITMRGDQDENSQIVFDRHYASQMKRLWTNPVPGPAVEVFGEITAWNSNGPYFRLSVVGFGRRLQCNYPKLLDRTVRSLAAQNQLVRVTGVAYYPADADAVPPPLYIQVESLEAAHEQPTPAYIELGAAAPKIVEAAPPASRQSKRRVARTPPGAPTLWDTPDSA